MFKSRLPHSIEFKNKNEKNAGPPTLKKYTEWDCAELAEWVQEVMNLHIVPSEQIPEFQKKVAEYMSRLKKEEINGASLPDLIQDADTLKDIFPVFSHRATFKKAVEKLMVTQTYGPVWVKRKFVENIMSGTNEERKSELSNPSYQRDLSLRAMALGDTDQLMDNYLNWDWAKTKELYQLESAFSPEAGPQSGYGSHSNESGSTAPRSGPFASHASRSVENLSPLVNPQDNQEFIQQEEKEIEQLLDYFVGLHQKRLVRMKVKLVVTEIMNSNFDKGVRKFFSPVANFFHLMNAKYGWFHVALVVGPWLIEWNDSGLCIPRKPLSRSALITCDLGEGFEIDNEEIISAKIRTLASVIVRWNTTMKYASKAKTPGEGNCQDFVESVLKELDIDQRNFIPPHSALGLYLERMKNHGECEMVFPITASFIKQYANKLDPELSARVKSASSNGGVIKFETHQELDTFVSQLKAADLGFVRTSDCILLKSFDRALWMRHFKTPDALSFLPLPVNSEHNPRTGCPFDHPEYTKSLISEYQFK